MDIDISDLHGRLLVLSLHTCRPPKRETSRVDIVARSPLQNPKSLTQAGEEGFFDETKGYGEDTYFSLILGHGGNLLVAEGLDSRCDKQVIWVRRERVGRKVVRVGGARIRVEFRGFCLLYNLVARFSGGCGGLSPALGSPQGSSNQEDEFYTAGAWPWQKIFLQIVILERVHPASFSPRLILLSDSNRKPASWLGIQFWEHDPGYQQVCSWDCYDVTSVSGRDPTRLRSISNLGPDCVCPPW